MAAHTEEHDLDIVAIWLRKDPTRWIAGALAGAFAGVVMLAFASLLCAIFGPELWFPVKLGAVPFLGNIAMEYGFNLGAILLGFIVIEIVCVFWGVLYAHFTGTNFLPALLGMGVVWGTFAWIFLANLYFQSIPDIKAIDIPFAPTFFTLIVWGVSLTSVAFFDRALRGNRR